MDLVEPNCENQGQTANDIPTGPSLFKTATSEGNEISEVNRDDVHKRDESISEDRDKSDRRQRKSRSRSKSRKRDERRRNERRSSRRVSSRSSSKSKSPDKRKRRRSKGRSRRDRSSDSSSSDESSRREKRRREGRDSYKYQDANNTVMIRGLALQLNENDIRADMIKSGILPKDIRLIRNHETGTSRGFAFVEFHTVTDAVRWMTMKKGVLTLHDKFQSNLIYSIPRKSTTEGAIAGRLTYDWSCSVCCAHNFKKRELCFKCGNSRPPALQQQPDTSSSSAISPIPTKIILLSNLDTLTTEDEVLNNFRTKPHLASIPIKTVKILRDPVTSISNGLCYIETNNVDEAIKFFSTLTHDALKIDGRTVSVAYGRAFFFTTPKNNSVAVSALAAAQWTNCASAFPPSTSTSNVLPKAPCEEIKTEDDVEKMSHYSSKLYSKTLEEYTSNVVYYRQYYKEQLQTKLHLSTSSNYRDVEIQPQPPYEFHQQYDNNPVGSKKDYDTSEKVRGGEKQDAMSYYKYAENIASDPVACSKNGSNVTSFYNANFQGYSGQSMDMMGEMDGTTEKNMNRSLTVHSHNGDTHKQNKVDKLDNAQRIVKNMEKWAKSLNRKKDANKPLMAPEAVSSKIAPLQMKSLFFKEGKDETTSHNQTKCCMELKSECKNSTPLKRNIDQCLTDEKASSIVPKFPNHTFIDENSLTCLLCKRRFSNKDILEKHVKMSELHKKNLELLQSGSKCSITHSNADTRTYKDRAKERREQFGSTNEVIKNNLKDLYDETKIWRNTSLNHKPAPKGINDDNIGNRMLQNMGWHLGQGLGKDNQGRVDIITTQRREGNLGLGIRIPDADDDKMDAQARVHKITLARFQELD